MMTRRKRLTIVILILLALLLLLIWFLIFLFSSPKIETSGTVEQTDAAQEKQEENAVALTPKVSEQRLQQEREKRTVSADLVSLSKTFVARYGSYSNEAEFANLKDVLGLMSDSFAASTRDFIESNKAPEEYYGVTTGIITVKVDAQTGNTAQVTVTTQRKEAIDSPQNIEVRYQDIVLTFVKEADAWKVDSAIWQ